MHSLFPTAMRIQPENPLPGAGPTVAAAREQLRSGTVVSVPRRRDRSVEYVDEIVVLSPFVRRILWHTVLLLIVANAAVLAVFTNVYARNDDVDSLLWVLRNYFLFSDSITFLRRYSTRIAVGYGALSASFACIALRMIVKALARRPFRLGQRLLQLARSTRRFSLTRSSTTAGSKGKSTRKVAVPIRVKRAIQRARRAIGVRGPYFELRLLLEESIELGTQTYAAYSASHSISNSPLNLTYAVVIFLNSISTLVFTRVFPRSLVKQRLACVVTDLVLDFVWGTLLPVWMYVPIVQRYLHRSSILDDPTSISGFTRAVQRILMLEWRSYVVSVIPFLSSLIKLLDLQYILSDLRPRLRHATNGRTEVRTQVHVGKRTQGRLPRLVHALMPLYGLGVLVTSLAAHESFGAFAKQNSIPCGYRVHPWFSTQEACLQRKLNCSALGVQGDAVDFTSMLDGFDRASLSEIFFLECPALTMPARIQQFPWLMSIVVVDSTIVTWDETAVLSDAYFTDLRNVQLYGVEFVGDPVGLTGLHGPVAACLEWIHLEAVNGERVLSLVGTHWHRLQAFGCIDCGLTAFPDLVYELRVLEILSLRVNDLAFIPDDWLARHDLKLQMLWLNDNPRLTTLPDSLWRQAATCGVFAVARTNLSVVPDWLADVAFPGFQITAIDSPVCTGQATVSPRVQELVFCG